jgi:hypothetical protein
MLDVATKLYSMWREILTLGHIETDCMLFASASCMTLQLHVAPSSKPPIRCPCFVFNVLAVSRIHYLSSSLHPGDHVWFLSWLCIHMHMLCSRTRVWTLEPNPQEKQTGKLSKWIWHKEPFICTKHRHLQNSIAYIIDIAYLFLN